MLNLISHLVSENMTMTQSYRTLVLNVCLKHLCDHGGKQAELRGSFSSAASTSRSTKVNTCVLKSAPGLGVIGTRASFTESSSSERGAYIET